MYQYPNYLMHHGVKGMKWGVRRQQRKATYNALKKSYGFNTYTSERAKATNSEISRDEGFKKAAESLRSTHAARTKSNRENMRKGKPASSQAEAEKINKKLYAKERKEQKAYRKQLERSASKTLGKYRNKKVSVLVSANQDGYMYLQRKNATKVLADDLYNYLEYTSK